MHSIRTKITVLTACGIMLALTIATIFGVFVIRSVGRNNAKQLLTLLCETGEKNLDSYFSSVEQSVEIVSTYVQEDLNKRVINELDQHIEQVKAFFGKSVSNTNGVLTYYYRIDPQISETNKGFWFVNLNDEGFVEHEVTDITKYDTEDTSQLVWFTVPKNLGKSIWLSPYVTDNLDVLVFSYNVPVYQNETFVGVVGIEIDYKIVADQVNNIKLYQNGYAFINDKEGNIICHPLIDVAKITEENKPVVPKGLVKDSKYIRYTYDGVEKEGVWAELDNGMILNVTVPVSEINSNWKTLLFAMIIVLVILLLVFIVLTLHITGRITRPLHELSEGAKKVNTGNYDVKLEYNGNDEIGVLTKTFNQLITHLKGYISELNSLVYDDALTSVHNKGAFDSHIHELQEHLNKSKDSLEFAIIILDCDNLKLVNDQFGHQKGDVYLKATSNLICSVFKNSSVFRIGGDEFAVILQNDDYHNCDELVSQFEAKDLDLCLPNDVNFKIAHVSLGLAVYDSHIDNTVNDVVSRADRLMYENKRNHKALRKN